MNSFDRHPEALFRALFEAAPDATLVVDGDGTIALANREAERLFRYSRDELTGEPIQLVIPEPFHGLVGRRRDGTEFAIEMSLGETDEGVLVAAVRDVTERRRAEQATLHLAAVVESSSDAIIGASLDGTIISWNPGGEALYGYRADEMIGLPVSMLVPPGLEDDVRGILLQVSAGERVDEHETVRRRKDGRLVDVSLTVSPIRDHTGTVVGAATIARDIGERLRYQEQLRYLAEHDALTGVRNRRRFERDLDDQVTRARRYGEHAALLVIDLDDLKDINDTHGHHAGDTALKELAGVLAQRLRHGDRIGRLGGDEFAVLLPHADAEEAATVMADLLRAIREHDGEGLPVRLSASIGLAVIDDATASADEALVAADRAMYEQKNRLRAATFPA